ncbi:MAG TPA: MFS transporter [Kiritimatiellia bacterium]|nr:MAG: putative MFS-type transporter YhjX [Verrucomicrobia bacterium ADurb.Bin070]HPB11302.1 MFS transporter [Kiritimatiellia bacterium]HPO36465.1 MFS transporter [Kiritimatiellia bacterium]HQA37620.1 MFS transporter [Kiritimatiellia bacterium]
MKQAPSRAAAGWRSSQTLTVTAAFLALFALVGFALYGLPFFYDFMTREYGWSRATVTSGNALGKLLVGPLFGFIAGWLVDRFGPQRLMAAGALLGGLALAGLSMADTLPLFYLFYVLNALAYVCGGPLPCQVLIARRFDKNRGKAMGIAYLGIGAGGALVPLVAARLQHVLGWHHALLALGGLIVLLAFPLPLLLKNPGTAPQQAGAAPPPAAPKVDIGAILRSPAFYLLAFGSMCSIGAVGGVMQHLKLYLRDQTFTQEGAARILSLVLLSSLAGRVLMGWLADRFSRKHVMLLIYLLVATAIPLLLLPAFPGRIYVFAVLFGIGLGGDYMIIPLMAGDLFGVRALGRVMGIILVADGVAESAFPMLVGALYSEAAKSYALGFSVLIAVALAGASLIAFLPKPRAQP